MARLAKTGCLAAVSTLLLVNLVAACGVSPKGLRSKHSQEGSSALSLAASYLGGGGVSPELPSSAIPALAVHAIGNAPYGIHDYGSGLQGNKAGLASACDRAGANAQEKAVIIAIAMQETTYMNPSERDYKKDHTQSANVSILNMNIDMLQHLGYTGTDYGSPLNATNRLTDAVGYMLKGFRTWGIERTLNYHRGGWTAFNDGVSYDAYGYRNAVLTIYNQIKGAPAMETDGRRVEVNTIYQ